MKAKLPTKPETRFMPLRMWVQETLHPRSTGSGGMSTPARRKHTDAEIAAMVFVLLNDYDRGILYAREKLREESMAIAKRNKRIRILSAALLAAEKLAPRLRPGRLFYLKEPK